MFDPNKIDKSTFSTNPYIRRIEKPWGWELHWTPDNLPYMGKILHIDAGKQFSLQIHDLKQESWFLRSGKGLLIWDNEKGEIVETEIKEGVGYTCHVGQKHRIRGITDVEVIEVSTPEIGTTYRLEDDYKRPNETEEQRIKERNKTS